MSATITPQEIKEIRGAYGLSQKSFAQLLGIGAASIVRYEQGAEPSKANANLIRAARYPEVMRDCLERDGDQIPEAQRVKASRVVYALISLSPEEGEGANKATQPRERSRSKMDEVYHYTIQQEVLNEQAANLMAEMISMRLSKGFSGDAAGVFENLLDQVAQVKPRIVSSDSDDDEKLAFIRGYLYSARDLLRRQKGEVA